MNNVFAKIESPKGKAILENSNALNNDIIKVIHKNYPAALRQTQKISKYFKGNSPEETANNIWDFLRNDIEYVRDPETHQLVRLPARLLSDRKGDCKSYSLFAASIFKNCYPKSKVKFRYACYSIIPIPTHVYVVAIENGKEIIIDGVYKKFNDQKKFTIKKDYEMKVYTLSGIGCENNTLGGFKDWVKKQTTSIKKDLSNPGQALKKYIGAPERGAYLGLVLLNVHFLATNLAKAILKDSAKVKSKWISLGGDYNQLVDAVNKGSKKKGLFGIGSVTAVAAALTAATPIIIAMRDTLKSLGIKDDLADPNKETGSVSDTSIETVTDSGGNVSADTKTSFDINPTYLLIGAAVIAGFFLLSKKRK